MEPELLPRKFEAVNGPRNASKNGNQTPDSILTCTPLSSDSDGNFVRPDGRKVTLKGINIDGASKLPFTPYTTSLTGDPKDPTDAFFDGTGVSFVGRPFPLHEAREHFERIKSWGYNVVRYVMTWEAIEHEGPGVYDDDFIAYTIEMLRLIHSVGGIYVILETHQDVWSRYSGGSGAPMWTFYAAGLDPRNFEVTEAAVLHNESRFDSNPPSDTYHKMMWTSNYKRLASLVMFTAFFCGREYFPLLTINGENIQNYLQNCYLRSVEHFWAAVNNALPEMIEDGTILGFELLNEPNPGLFGYRQIDVIPKSHQLRVGTTPSVYDAMRLGMGLPCKVDEYRISITGPRKFNSRIVDPQGVRAWLSTEETSRIDLKYGWKRGSDWPVGECIFAKHGIWKWDSFLQLLEYAALDSSSRVAASQEHTKLVKPDYFHDIMLVKFKGLVINNDTFINNHFIDFFLKFKNVIRQQGPIPFVFMLILVLEEPPKVINDERQVIDPRVAVCPHYYDGMSLMFKSWCSWYNVDTLGIVRGRYLNPIFGLCIGQKSIRKCIQKQFIEIKKEIISNMGPVPVLMSETGMPFDMDGKEAYKTGDYSSQTTALDVLCSLLEALQMNHTYWCYTSINTHRYGDGWNNEDFLFWSADDCKSKRQATLSVDGSPTVKDPFKVNVVSESADDPSTGRVDGMSTAAPDNIQSRTTEKLLGIHYDGVRAIDAVIRPYTLATKGSIVGSCFDLKGGLFKLTVDVDLTDSSNSFPPTLIFIPKWHYPSLTAENIQLTSGSIVFHPELEYLEWFHNDGPDSRSNSSLSTKILPRQTIIVRA